MGRTLQAQALTQIQGQTHAISWENPDPDDSADARLRKLAEAGATWEGALREFLASDASRF